MKELIYEKGYLLKTVSWENDGDHYKTTNTKVINLKEAKAFQRLLTTLFAPSYRTDEPTIGNSFGSERDKIEAYRLSDNYFNTNYTEEEFFKFINEGIRGFIGYSEDYTYRVCESCTLYRVPEDVYLTVIK